MREDRRRSQFPPYPLQEAEIDLQEAEIDLQEAEINLQEAEINLTKVKAVFKCSNEIEKGNIVSFLVRLVLSRVSR